jgi:hypothetical protein
MGDKDVNRFYIAHRDRATEWQVTVRPIVSTLCTVGVYIGSIFYELRNFLVREAGYGAKELTRRKAVAHTVIGIFPVVGTRP